MRFGRRKNKNPGIKLGLCLSGGGARGFAHIGAIRAFQEAGIDFDLTVGVSAGAIVGALYAAGVSADEMARYAATIEMKRIHSGRPFPPADASNIGRLVTDLIGDADIEHLPRRFVCLATDLVEAKQVLLDRGSVGLAVSASCCVPVLFKPVVRGEQHLVDGGLLNNIPADITRMLGVEKVVTVDINPTRGSGTRDLGLLGVIKATLSISLSNASIQGYSHSDVIVAPDLSAFRSTDKAGYEEMMRLGYESARAKIDDIIKLKEGAAKP